MTLTTLLIIGVLLALIASVAAFINTHIILRELNEIKLKLGIKDKRSSFFDKDLDN